MHKLSVITAFGLLLLLGISSCTSTNRLAQDDLSRLYNKRSSPIHPEYFLYHVSPDSSDLYFKIKTEELLYTRDDKASMFRARVLISYKVYDNLNGRVVLDSASTQLIDLVPEQTKKEMIGTIRIKMPMNAQHVMKIEAIDVNRKQNHIGFLNVDKRLNSRQNFLLIDPEREAPIFSPYLPCGKDVILEVAGFDNRELYGRFYLRKFPLAAPPFSMYNLKTFRYEADSLFTGITGDDSRFLLTIPEKGFIHLQLDTATKIGLTLFGFPEEFPSISSHESMLMPMRFITSKAEFNKIKGNPSLKKGIEDFWVSHAGSKERAREVIKAYYSRVQNANKHFTSFVEGWKTDRGLVHIIYGNPNLIHKSDDAEVWVYGEETSASSITFTFIKVTNPFTDNDFTLSRNPNFKTNWYRALESWRQGRVYTSF
jgi:GWxTD domain-containing protein